MRAGLRTRHPGEIPSLSRNPDDTLSVLQTNLVRTPNVVLIEILNVFLEGVTPAVKLAPIASQTQPTGHLASL